MKTQELRQFSAEELAGRVTQWKDELFRTRIKSNASEGRDTSVFKKLRRDIARANTIIGEKRAASSTAPQDVVTKSPGKKTGAQKGEGA